METDGVDEAVDSSMRAALMASSRIAEQLARVRENQLRHAEQSGAQEARELQNRLDTERLAARAQLAVVNRPEWWDAAPADDVVEVWQTAHAWRTTDPEVERAALVIEGQIQDRWGIDVHNTGARPDQVREHLQRILDATANADEERARAKKAEAEAIELLLTADRLQSDREAGLVEDIVEDEARETELREQAGLLTSAAAGHASRAAEYESVADQEAVEAKVAADEGQAYPARLATSKAGKSSKRTRRPSGDVPQERAVSR